MGIPELGSCGTVLMPYLHVALCDDAPMIERPANFAQTAGDTFLPTHYSQSRWGADHLNGQAVVGLVASVLEQAYGDDDFLPARLTVDLFKAARGVPTIATTRLLRNGRRVRNCECELVQDGLVVVRATLVQYRRSAPPDGDEWFAQIDLTPPSLAGVTTPIYVASDGNGWSSSIADHQNASRKRFFNRPVDVLADRGNTPFVNAAAAAEGTSLLTNLGSAGVGYINGDLTVGLARLPVDDWIGGQADSHWAADGVSVGTATLFDSLGPFGTGLVTAISNPAAQIDFGDDADPVRATPA